MDDTDEAASGVTRQPLRSLGLKPGMALQTRRLVEGASKKESQYFGAIEGKGVMVGPLGPEGSQTGLSAGEICVVRGFTGQYEYSFIAKVLQTFEKPFAYALLAYPAQVDARLVRQSMRTRCAWPCTLALPTADGGLERSEVSLVDLSLYGAMIKSPTAQASMGSVVGLTLSVRVEEEAFDLELSASVCHANWNAAEGAYFVGVAFKGLSGHDRLVLNYVTQSPPA